MGIIVSRGSPRIIHLLFADDIIFFYKLDAHICSTLNMIMRKYEVASGQKINSIKSANIFSLKTPSHAKEKTKRDMHIPKEGGVSKYLGLPEHIGRRKRRVQNNHRSDPTEGC